MAEPTTAENIKNAAAEILQIDPKTLLQQAKWGEIDFQGGAQDLSDIRSLVRPLTELPVRFIPESEANLIHQRITETYNIIKRIEDFTINQQNPTGERDSIINELKYKKNELYSVISIHAAYLALQSGDLEKIKVDLVTSKKEIESMLVETKEFVSTSNNEIKTIIETAREVAGNAGVGQFSTDFQDASKNHDSLSIRWLVATGILAFLSAAAAFLSFFLVLPPEASVAQVLQTSISKVVLLTVLISSTFWCGRQYRALRHQSAINLHRANALRTFQAFIQASPEGPTREAVLLETTRSIFALTSSGYLAGGDSGDSDPLKIVELIRTAGRTGGEA